MKRVTYCRNILKVYSSQIKTNGHMKLLFFTFCGNYIAMKYHVEITQLYQHVCFIAFVLFIIFVFDIILCHFISVIS